MPKSLTFSVPSDVSSRFSALRSRWITPASCSAWTPAHAWARSRVAACQSIGEWSAAHPPCNSSMASHGLPLVEIPAS